MKLYLNMKVLSEDLKGVSFESSKILNKKMDKPSTGRNSNAVSDIMLAQLSRFSMHGVSTELGYLKYVTDPADYKYTNYDNDAAADADALYNL